METQVQFETTRLDIEGVDPESVESVMTTNYTEPNVSVALLKTEFQCLSNVHVVTTDVFKDKIKKTKIIQLQPYCLQPPGGGPNVWLHFAGDVILSIFMYSQ